jgi:predicted MFS family arabinose efflux permease
MNRRLVVFILFTAAYFLSYFYRSANAVIASDLSAQMGLDAGQLGLMTSLFFGSFALIQIPLGIALDRWGPRWVTPILMITAVVGSLVFASAPSFVWLAIGRTLIGVGMAGVLMGSLTILSRWFPAERYATVSGLLVGIGASGSLAAATPLAWLNDAIGWRAVFTLGAGVTAVVIVAILLWTRNTPAGVEWTGANASVDIRPVFGDGRFWRIAPITFFLAGATMGFQGLWAGPYLFDIHGLDEVVAGNVLLLLGVGVTLGYGFSGWLADRFGLERIIVSVGAIFVVAQFALAARPPLAWVAVIYLIFGFTGGFNVMTVAQVRRIFPLEMIGKAVTAANMFAIGGTFLLQWLMGVIINAYPVQAGHYPPAAYTTALLCIAVGSLISVLWYLPLAMPARGAGASAQLSSAGGGRS